MPVHGHRYEWFLSFALFAAILLALVVAVMLQAPLEAAIPGT